MSSNFGEIVKKLIPVFGEKPARGLPKSPPPPRTAPGLVDSHTWRKHHIESPRRQIRPPKWDAGVGEGGGGRKFRAFQITQQRSNISRCFFHTMVCIPFLLLIAVAYCAHLLSTCLAGENGALYCEGRAYKRVPKLVASPQSTALHSTGNISAEDSVYKNKVGHNSTRGIVSPLLFFPLKLLLHKVYISNILCGLRLWIQDVYSKEKPFVSNVHINI
jgi:hypothetical protein